MKKLILSSLFVVVGIVSANAQNGFKVGAHLGFPVGDASDYYGMNFGVEATYLYPISDVFHLGGTAGIDVFSGKEVTGTGLRIKNLTLLPIAISGQLDFLDQFFAAADLGYAFSLSKNYDGGFYFQPKGGWQDDTWQTFLFIKAISSDVDVASPYYGNYSTITTIGVGGAYKF